MGGANDGNTAAGGSSEPTSLPTDDPTLLHIRLKQEAQERAMRTSPPSKSINTSTSPSRHRFFSNSASSSPQGQGQASFGYDGRDVYPSSAQQSNTATRGHNRASSLGGGTSIIAPSSTAAHPGAGGGINAGWYMTTGVLPAVIQSSPEESLSRSGSLGQRSRLSKYGSLYDATGLERGGTIRSQNTMNTLGGAGQQDGGGTKQNDARSTIAPTIQSHTGTGRPVSPDYVQNVSGLRSKLLDDTAEATAANKAFAANTKHEYKHPHRHPIPPSTSPTSQQQQHVGMKDGGVSAIPVSPRGQQNEGMKSLLNEQQQQQQGSLPPAVANAAQTAQHRRNISMDRQAVSPPLQNQALPPTATGTGMGTSVPLLHNQTNDPTTRQPPLGQERSVDPANNQGRFQEEMSMIGRKSVDSPSHRENLGLLPAALASTGPSRGDSLKNKQKGADAIPISAENPVQNQAEGLSSYNRGDLLPSSSTRQGNDTTRALPEEMGEALPASEIARQRELQHAYANQGAREEPRLAAGTVGISDPPPASKGTEVPPVMPGQIQGRGLPKQETVTRATQGPSHQTTRVSEPRVLSTKTQQYLEHPLPNISYPAPNHPNKEDLFGNIAQPIPHYMFVNYTASICQECVASEQRMHALTHGGEKWRYSYADPMEEKEIPSDNANTRKTGREEYKDEISLLRPKNRFDEDGNEKGPCECDECLKNRATVKMAAENGLIEKIFEGRRHPASELIETTTYTTIIRAPIIRETITTIWCEEPNCKECAIKQEEYEKELDMKRLERAMNGMVIHETDGSDGYKGYKNLVDVDGARGGASSTGERGSIDRLLKIAGNPRQEKLRRMPGTTAEFDGHIVGYDDEELKGRVVEEVKPSNADVVEIGESGELK